MGTVLVKHVTEKQLPGLPQHKCRSLGDFKVSSGPSGGWFSKETLFQELVFAKDKYRHDKPHPNILNISNMMNKIKKMLNIIV